jgi:hypothetical protein
MGSWFTVHLFDSKIFENKVSSLLKNSIDNLKPYYFEYMKTSIPGGIEHWTDIQIEAECEDKLNHILNCFSLFDSKLEKHSEFDKLAEYKLRQEYCARKDWYYDFYSFFEYLMFSICADYFPHLICGKRSLEWKLQYPDQSISYELISMLDKEVGNTVFCLEGAGIISWLSIEDTKLLYYDQDNITSEEDAFRRSFMKILEVAYDNSLGLLLGVDLRSSLYNLQGFKLVKKDKFKDICDFESFDRIVCE